MTLENAAKVYEGAGVFVPGVRALNQSDRRHLLKNLTVINFKVSHI